MMTFKDLMDKFDNPNSIVKVNNEKLEMMVRGKAFIVMERCADLYDKEVMAFGFYSFSERTDFEITDFELTVRLRV